jgi:predicted DNA-binding ribbon-helix-helix protein
MTQASSFFKNPARLFANNGKKCAMATLKKRSVQLSGHATSIALEPEFWAVLDEMAGRRGQSLAALIGSIDKARGARPLASACRVAALAFATAARG